MLTHSSNVVPIFPLARKIAEVRELTAQIQLFAALKEALVWQRVAVLGAMLDIEQAMGMTHEQAEELHAQMREAMGL